MIDARGLESLSLELVARKLGVKAPSLYYHFGDKAELLAEVARLIFVDVEAPDVSGEWQDDIVELCLAVRRSILRHPNAAPLLLQFFPRHQLLGAYDRNLTAYPFTPAENIVLMEGLEKLTFGSALFESAARAQGVPAFPEVDPDRYPTLALTLRKNRLSDEDLFVETLRTFIAGRVERRAGANTPRARRPRGRSRPSRTAD